MIFASCQKKNEAVLTLGCLDELRPPAVSRINKTLFQREISFDLLYNVLRIDLDAAICAAPTGKNMLSVGTVRTCKNNTVFKC